MFGYRFLAFAGWLTLAVTLSGKESICFNSGFCMEVDAHTQKDGILKLQTRGGTMEFPADQIAQISAVPESAAVNAVATGAHNVVEPTLEDIVMRAAIEQGLEPNFVRSVARMESGLQQQAISPKGAVGVMQLMPGTAAGLGVDPKMADQNALGGAKFLRELLLRYGGNSVLALAAYNAGPGAVAKFGGVPPYLETRRYIVKVLQEYARQQHSQASRAASKPSATN